MGFLKRACRHGIYSYEIIQRKIHGPKYFRGSLLQQRYLRSWHPLLSQNETALVEKSPETPLFRQLQARIKLMGPLTIYDYMKEVLINPISGYYSAGPDMFGSSGDYITSPEISQMFGEMVGIWIFSEWYKLGSVKPLQLAELGPGRGTLMNDVLRVLKRLGLSEKDISIHLVEASSELSRVQEKQLCLASSDNLEMTDDVDFYKKNITTTGSDIYWYRHLGSIPKDFTIYFANEFFDALPVHKFRSHENGWREVLIDIDEGDGPHHLRYILSREATPASKIFIKADETRADFEVSPDTAVICNELATRIEQDGGIALIMDYGHNGNLSNTFRAFKNHSLHDPLCEPGIADITADVDFKFIKENVQDKIVTYGPVTQSFFLHNTGIEQRLHRLLRSCNENDRKNLISGYKMLTEPKQMGERFKFFAMFPAVVKQFLIKYPPAGFHVDFDKE